MKYNKIMKTTTPISRSGLRPCVIDSKCPCLCNGNLSLRNYRDHSEAFSSDRGSRGSHRIVHHAANRDTPAANRRTLCRFAAMDNSDHCQRCVRYWSLFLWKQCWVLIVPSMYYEVVENNLFCFFIKWKNVLSGRKTGTFTLCMGLW